MRMTGATAQLAERMQKDQTENALKQITAHIAAQEWMEVLTMAELNSCPFCGTIPQKATEKWNRRADNG